MSCKIVVIIDESGSMGHQDPGNRSSYLDSAKTAASTFIAEMQPGDRLGVVAFSDDARIIFGNKASLIPIGDKTPPDALAAIRALTPLKTTNMVAAFETALGMMPGVHGLHDAEVFLSDGYFNTGGDPLKAKLAGNPNEPLIGTPLIYTIALGPASDADNLEKIAHQTTVKVQDKVVKTGQFHYAHSPRELCTIYNAIAGEAGVAALVVTEEPTLQSFKSAKTPATVPSGATRATFAISWDNRAVVFTPHIPVGDEVQIVLFDPSGIEICTSPSTTGEGFAVFKILNPVAGEYAVSTWYSGEDALSCTVSVFDDITGITAAIAGPPERVTAGSPAMVEVRLADGGDPIDGAQIQVSLESPLVTLAEAVMAHAERLRTVSVPKDITEESRMAAKILALQRQTGEDLLPRQLRPMTAQATSGGLYRVQIPIVEKAGSHTVRVVARGYSAKSKTKFQRTTRISLFASES